MKRPTLLLVGDMLLLALTFLISLYFFRDARFSWVEWIVLSVFILTWLLVSYRKLRYYSTMNNEKSEHVSNHIKAYSAFVALVFLFYSFFPVPVSYDSGLIALIVGFPVLGIVMNFLLVKLSGGLSIVKKEPKYTLVAGVGNVAKRVENQMYSRKAAEYQIKGFINIKNNEECAVGKEKVVGDITNIQQYLKDNPVDEIVIAIPVERNKRIQDIISAADYHGVRVKYILDYQDVFGKNYKVTRFGNIDAVNVRQLPVDEKYSSFIKNTFDLLFSSVALILLSPIFLLLAIMIKLDSPGPVFYCPIRIGKGGKAFKVYKFRSMRQNDSASDGTLSTQQNDPRVTKLGRILRKYSIDELPQFINVFLGDMSVVGPRPHRRYLNQQLQESVYKYMVRHYIKPGITGWAQVNGWRGPTDTEEQRKQRTLHDLWYMENWSFWLDLKIIFLTIFSSKTRKSAF